ncbi:hypothetical protein GCM10018785_19720 [Streptomyces longispororuber]|uniref:Uncharacterized protein n=1 Tax=Streptomyces longispororuber TaxID=68230 RepID=A0A918ZFQ3_9ACTN|nr:GrpB family protein [Streptomyces longispororuber]GHE50155.1 hypothetical protein GCM10018785_19720 [Streptomyces longispororuber]
MPGQGSQRGERHQAVPAAAEECLSPAAGQQAPMTAEEIEAATIGATAEPGLLAQPVLDLVLTVPDPADEAAYVPVPERLGHRLALREPAWYEHRVLRRRAPGPGADSANLHVFPPDCPGTARMLPFRDRLRTHPGERDLYARTKWELAARTWDYTQNYADAKSAVVAGILRRATGGEPR